MRKRAFGVVDQGSLEIGGKAEGGNGGGVSGMTGTGSTGNPVGGRGSKTPSVTWLVKATMNA